MEQFTISIGNGFSIENKANVNKDVKSINHAHISPFADFELVSGEINWIYNPFPINDDDLELIKEIELLNKEVSFDVFLLVKGEWKKEKSFDGTFVDALEYIQKAFTYE